MKYIISSLVFFLILFLTSNLSSGQYCDRSFEMGAGLEYPLYVEKYNPMLSLDLYVYCIGIGTDFGLFYNNERVEEFSIGRYLGPSFNFNIFTELDPTRISPTLDRFMLNMGYKYSQQTLTNINDMKGKTHYLYLKTEYCVSRYFILYNKLDFKLGSNQNVTNSAVLVSFGFRFFVNSNKKGFKNSPKYND
jgi:hypothetical protein